jgi:hypothetical protein
VVARREPRAKLLGGYLLAMEPGEAISAVSSHSSGSQYVREVHRSVGVFAESDSDETATAAANAERDHREGRCNPCIYIATKAGCRFGELCRYCHEAHPNRSLARLVKTCETMLRMIYYTILFYDCLDQGF